MLGYNFIAVDIGNRYFSSGNQIQTVNIRSIHVLGKFRQLARSPAGITIGHEWWENFYESIIFYVIVQHKIDQRSFQTGTLPGIQRESASSNLGSTIKIEKIKFGT